MMSGRAVAIAAVASGVVTAAVVVRPASRVLYGPELASSLETAAFAVTLLAVSLAVGRLRREQTRNHLALACGLAVICLSNLLFGLVPALAGLAGANWLSWSAIISRSLGGLLFGLAAFVPDHPLRRPARAQAAAAAGVIAAIALTAILPRWLASDLPAVVSIRLPVHQSVGPALRADPASAALEALTALLGILAAAGYLGRSRRLGDEFSGWLALAAVFVVASQVNYLLYPSLQLQVVSLGDAFRLCFDGLVLAATISEICSYWRALPAALALSERHRIACDLHDGLAQELAYLTRNLDALGGSVEPEILDRLCSAAGRAQLESRLAVSRLAIPGPRQEATALADAVGQVARRFAVDLDLDLQPGVRLAPPRSEALVRIACEAVSNAARHSGARQVSLSLHRHGSRVRLRVSDNGSGFDPGLATAGFGLASMRERASSVGGDLRISSAPGQGTEVVASL